VKQLNLNIFLLFLTTCLDALINIYKIIFIFIHIRQIYNFYRINEFKYTIKYFILTHSLKFIVNEIFINLFLFFLIKNFIKNIDNNYL
jgi:hypothetical protein